MPTLTNRSYLLKGVIIAMAMITPVGAGATEVLIYLNDGEVLSGDLLRISRDRVVFNPPGPVTLQAVRTAQVDSVVQNTQPRTRLFPVEGHATIADVMADHKRSTQRQRPAYSFCYFSIYREPVKVAKLLLSNPSGGADPLVIEIRMGAGHGRGVCVGTLFPINESGTALRLDVEMTIPDANWYGDVNGEEAVVFDGSIMMFDFTGSVRVPLGKVGFPLFLAPGLGFGLRRISATDGTIWIEENHAAYLVSLQLECQLLSWLGLTTRARAWNSELDDLPYADVPRFTEVDFRAGLNLYLY